MADADSRQKKPGAALDFRIPGWKPNADRPFSFADLIPQYSDDEKELLVLQQSWADYARGLRTGVRARVKSSTEGNNFSFRGGSLAQVNSIFDVFSESFREGDKTALIDALRLACEENVPLPYWLADGILAALTDLDANPAANLHSVFGMETRYRTSKKRSKKDRLDWTIKQKLYVSASQLIAQGAKKGEAIQQAIRGLPIEFRIAFKWFNEMDARQQKHLRAWRGIRLHKLR